MVDIPAKRGPGRPRKTPLPEADNVDDEAADGDDTPNDVNNDVDQDIANDDVSETVADDLANPSTIDTSAEHVTSEREHAQTPRGSQTRAS